MPKSPDSHSQPTSPLTTAPSVPLLRDPAQPGLLGTALLVSTVALAGCVDESEVVTPMVPPEDMGTEFADMTSDPMPPPSDLFTDPMPPPRDMLTDPMPPPADNFIAPMPPPIDMAVEPEDDAEVIIPPMPAP